MSMGLVVVVQAGDEQEGQSCWRKVLLYARLSQGWCG